MLPPGTGTVLSVNASGTGSAGGSSTAGGGGGGSAGSAGNTGGAGFIGVTTAGTTTPLSGSYTITTAAPRTFQPPQWTFQSQNTIPQSHLDNIEDITVDMLKSLCIIHDIELDEDGVDFEADKVAHRTITLTDIELHNLVETWQKKLFTPRSIFDLGLDYTKLILVSLDATQAQNADAVLVSMEVWLVS